MPTKSDANANEIVSALRSAGATVRFISFDFGLAGCPDALVGFLGATYLLELKIKRGRLSEAQKKFHAEWQGAPIHVVRSVAEAFQAIGITPPF
jgi:hypothetical protein